MNKNFKFSALIIICTISTVSFCFLNSIGIQQKNNSYPTAYNEIQSEHGQVSELNTENKFDSLNINKFNPGDKDNKEKSLLPSVEIFKYLAQKGLEMLPALRLKDFIPSFN
jgi:hypothetical protein